LVNGCIEDPLIVCGAFPSGVGVAYQAIESYAAQDVERQKAFSVPVGSRLRISGMCRNMSPVDSAQTAMSKLAKFRIGVSFVLKRQVVRGRLAYPLIVKGGVNKRIENLGYRAVVEAEKLAS
jgi:hypothetical protein